MSLSAPAFSILCKRAVRHEIKGKFPSSVEAETADEFSDAVGIGLVYGMVGATGTSTGGDGSQTTGFQNIDSNRISGNIQREMQRYWGYIGAAAPCIADGVAKAFKAWSDSATISGRSGTASGFGLKDPKSMAKCMQEACSNFQTDEGYGLFFAISVAIHTEMRSYAIAIIPGGGSSSPPTIS